MEPNKSTELAQQRRSASEKQVPASPQPAGFEGLLSQAEMAVRDGRVEESKEHLTRIFEFISLSPAHRAPAGSEGIPSGALKMSQSA
ncbi:MAG: hypothetical protein IT163_19420 [Bryobacterales bacterium]|nr:hypothetical protein [Bryobacterales bacterium]